MTVSLSDAMKQLVQLALRSHKSCEHDAPLCYLLISAEVEFRQGGLLDEEEFVAVGAYIAECVLESLILKGMVEATAVNEQGELMFGVTEAGKDAYSRFHTEGETDHGK